MYSDQGRIPLSVSSKSGSISNRLVLPKRFQFNIAPQTTVLAAVAEPRSVETLPFTYLGNRRVILLFAFDSLFGLFEVLDLVSGPTTTR